MNRTIPAIIIALSVAGCASIQNPFSKPTLAGIESAYGAAESLAVGYHDACRDRLIPPSCRPIVVKIAQYGNTAQAAVLRARSFVKNNPTVDATSILLVAQDAIAALKSVTPTTGAK